ncbi:phenylphosphate carboxylase subunit delta [Lysobacter enzymogenes]|uniref:KdsC family phosphatase n=1 Tax=Lysobacter enzymogenes TaxID=69 RepID=UPI0019D198C4|nr:HAD hydrolase family protein [Lysobacter enzymogenes]MBN7136783.1 phenylphosphate carboxylase subunit delta [Lysobacter enzymogenes]
MPYSHLNDYPADIRERAARIRLACFDVDGTLTDGRLTYDESGRESKSFHVQDGQGLALLRKHGIAVHFVTARGGAIAAHRAAELGASSHGDIKDKLVCVKQIAESLALTLEQVAFMGDDLADLRILPHVGLAVAPANAHPWVRERVHWRTHARGGEGAARELCDLLLGAQGHAEAILAGALG